ncbi:putative xylanase B, partial [Neocallimastix californiae]
KFRGHCLIWHNYQPEWFQNLKGEDLKNAIINHITTVLTHYKGKIDTWDIVNEALADVDATEENPFVLRDSFLLQEVPDYIDIAFKTAREIDPNLKLFYNEYYNEGGPHYNWFGQNLKKSNATFNFAKDLLDRGVPLDGVGLQYHIQSTSYPTYDQVMEVMAKYAEIGLEVQITEIDVRLDGKLTPELYELQARLYAEALKACLDSSNCTAFLIWGVSD